MIYRRRAAAACERVRRQLLFHTFRGEKVAPLKAPALIHKRRGLYKMHGASRAHQPKEGIGARRQLAEGE